MKNPYRGLDRQSFKLRIVSENTIVDEKNRRVIHKVEWELVCPTLFYFFTESILRTYKDCVIKGVAKGIAVCHPEDKFDATLGTKIARALAESNAYKNATRRLVKRMRRLDKIILDLKDMTADFELKTIDVETHNAQYLNEICV